MKYLKPEVEIMQFDEIYTDDSFGMEVVSPGDTGNTGGDPDIDFEL